MTISRTQIPKPENHQDFERFCAILWKEKLGDPNIQRFGRNGQTQHGIDIIGIRDGDPRKRVGIQCKLKTGTAELTENEVRAEFASALMINPPLSEYHIVTTADRDKDLQLLADELTIEQIDKGRRIRFVIWGWQAITDELGQYPDALLAFDDSYGVFGRQTLAQINKGIDLQQQGEEKILARLADMSAMLQTNQAPVDSTVEIALAVEKHLDAEIDGYRDANNGGQRTLALSQFTKLLERVQTGTVSGRILFRIKANIGSCHLQLGNEEKAIKWLLEAYEHAPTEPKAIANKAFAHLLLEDWDTVLGMGRENLETEAADATLSSHVIQAARFANVTDDPLSLIPPQDRDSEGVLIALALFQRSRSDLEWKITSRALAERFPEDRLARQLNAEAVLDDVIDENRFTDCANLAADELERLKSASLVLADLWAEIKDAEGKFDNADIALCGNLILAYRVQGDFASAIKIVRHALTISEIDDEFLLRAAAAAMEAGDPIIDEILPRLPATPSKNLLTVQAAVTKGAWELLGNLDPDDGEAYPPVERKLCETAIRLGTLWTLTRGECAAPLAEIVDDVQGDVRASIIVAQYCGLKGHPQLSERAIIPCWGNGMSHRFRSRFVPDGFGKSTGPRAVGLQKFQ